MARSLNESKWEFDLKSIQRAITPLIVLEVLNEDSESGIGAALIRQKTEMKLEESIAEFNPPHFELYPSVLYPMLGYMKDEGKWIKMEKDSSYKITEVGKKQMIIWRNLFQALSGVKNGNPS